MEWDSKNQIALASGVSFAVIIALLVLPVFAGKDTIFLVNGNNATPEPCNGNTGLVLAQNLTDLCDVTILSPVTNQIIKYNGSQWVNVNQAIINDTTNCFNLGTGTLIVYNSVGGNCNIKSLVNGTGIRLTNDSNTITIANTKPENTTCTSTDLAGADGNLCYGGNVELKSLLVDGGLTISNSCGGQCLLIVNSAPESTVCSNDGHGAGNVCNGGNVHLKGVASGTGITVTQNGTDIIITNSAVDTDITYLNKNTVGTNFQIFKNSTTVGSTTTNYFRTIVNSTGLSFTNDTNTITAKTNFANGTGIQITGTGKQTFTNTGVISNSCTAPIVCSGTNPSAISYADSPYWQMLCDSSLVSPSSSISCSITAKRFLHVYLDGLQTSTGTAGVFGFQFNSDNGTNYATRFSLNGGADTTNGSIDSCRPQGSNTLSTNSKEFTAFDINNRSTSDNKFVTGQWVSGANGAQSNIPAKVEFVCQWSNTSAQITTIVFTRISGTVNLNTGTELIVWGHD